MAIILTDKEILSLTQEEKKFPKGWESLRQMKDKKGHREQELTIQRNDGSQFKIILRQNKLDVLSFSIILGYMAPKSNILFRLRRYNGKHEHTNKIEKENFYDFHIHKATERYQNLGFDEDGYAEKSVGYNTIHNAIDCLIKDCNIILPEDSQMKLFH